METHLILLIAEATLAGGLILFLFWLRRFMGLTPLYLTIGAFQYLQVVLASSVQIEMAPGFLVNPGSAVLFPLTIFVVLLTYIERDAAETRKLAYGIVIANVALYVVAMLAARHVGVEGHRNPLGLPVELLAQSARINLVGTLALFLDVVAVIVVFEQVSRWVRSSLFLRLWLSVLVVMVLDSLLFTTGVFVGNRNFLTILAALVVAKSIATTFYAGLIGVYARLVERPGRTATEEGAVHDLFHVLTYRQRYEQARTKMTRDALTGLFNRGYFDETAPRHLAHANRAGHHMSLAMIDVDRLKDANDRHGHQAGDQLLTFVARQVEQMVRSADVACRYGGDEFMVVLTTADQQAARVFSERLLELVMTKSMDQTPVPPWAPASVTIGVAVYPDDGLTLSELVLRADERLYAGKRQGGARLVTVSSAERR